MTLVTQKAGLGDFLEDYEDVGSESGYPPGFQGLLDQLQNDMIRTTEGLELGSISPKEWNGLMKANISRGAQAAFMVGDNFSSSIDPEHLKSVKAWVGEQYRYLDQFTSTVNGAGEFDRAWYNRAKMYANATYTQYWEGATVGLPLPAQPAQGTQCLSNCKCRWDIKWLDKDAGDADCYWVMAAAEHCQTCQVRAASWNPVRIRGGMLEGLELPPEAPRPPAPKPAPKPSPKSKFGEMKPVKGYGGKKWLREVDEPKLQTFHQRGPKDRWQKLSDRDQKDQICTEISKRTKLPYEHVNRAIHQWANTSNDTSYASMELQSAAAKLNGTELSDWQKKIWERVKDHGTGEAGVFENMHLVGTKFIPTLAEEVVAAGYKTSQEACEAFLKAMYDYTQEEFKAAGVTHVRLFRGVSGVTRAQAEALIPYANKFESVPMSSNAMESWSISKEVADDFASGGITFEMVVPVERIIGSCRTGFGCVNEAEYVMLGNVPGDEALIARYWEFWKK